MRRLVAAAVLGAVVALPAKVEAQSIDAAHLTNEPGATLLLPYFEAQVPKKVGGKAPGVTTLFSINNASATAILVHVTLWTDLAVPVFAFNVYLTGFDVQTIDLVDVLNGKLPVTADAGDDPGDTASPFDGISNRGIASQDINFPGSMAGQPAQLDEATIAHLRASLTGKASPLNGLCSGRDYGEKKPIARGFVTADTVNNHTQRFPNVLDYFTGDVTFQNVLWGDYFFLHKSKKVGRGDALVALRASSLDPEVSDVTEYTFYDGQNGSLSAVDGRQPLGAVYAGRFVNIPKHPFYPTGTSTIAWRDPKQTQAAFPCGTTPAWFPLGQQQLVAFDEQENPELLTALPFPAAAQVVKVGGAAFPVAAASGWLYMDLNVDVGSGRPVEDPLAAQSFVSMVFESKGKYSVGTRAVVLDDAAEADHQELGIP